MKREEAIKILKEIRNLSSEFETYEIREIDLEALEYAIKELERTAQEVPVQEQLIDVIKREVIDCLVEFIKYASKHPDSDAINVLPQVSKLILDFNFLLHP